MHSVRVDDFGLDVEGPLLAQTVSKLRAPVNRRNLPRRASGRLFDYSNPNINSQPNTSQMPTDPMRVRPASPSLSLLNRAA